MYRNDEIRAQLQLAIFEYKNALLAADAAEEKMTKLKEQSECPHNNIQSDSNSYTLIQEVCADCGYAWYC